MRVKFSDRLIIERPRDHHSVLALKTLPLYMKVGKKPITFDKKKPPKNSLCLILHNLPQTTEIFIWVRLWVGPIKRRKRWVSVSGMRLRVVCFTLVILFIVTVSSRPPAATSRSDVCLVQTLPPFSTSLFFLISPERQRVRAALEVRKDVDIISLLAWNLPSVGSEFGQINAVAGEIMQPEQCCQAAELAVYSGCLRACGQEVYVREGEASTWDKGRKTPGRKKQQPRMFVVYFQVIS